jgi:hypothetical protein
MKNYLIGISFVFLLTFLVTPISMKAETVTTTSSSNVSALLEQMQKLMKQVEDLQRQLGLIKGELKEEIKSGLRAGMEDEDIKKIQELLATDPSLYPRGIVSGYFGPLTEEAISRFQERHGLTVTGEVDEATKALIHEYFKEKQNGKVPPGLLKSPGISQKMLERWKNFEDKRPKECLGAMRTTLDCVEKKEKPDTKTGTSSKDQTITEAVADRAINQADEAINDLGEAIDDASSVSLMSRELRQARQSLVLANRLLLSAEDYQENDKYGMAYRQAMEATKVAKKAMEKLDGEDEDDN